MENSESSQKVEADGTMGMVIGSMHPSKRLPSVLVSPKLPNALGGVPHSLKTDPPIIC